MKTSSMNKLDKATTVKKLQKVLPNAKILTGKKAEKANKIIHGAKKPTKKNKPVKNTPKPPVEFKIGDKVKVSLPNSKITGTVAGLYKNSKGAGYVITYTEEYTSMFEAGRVSEAA